jgi:hypothetical protein
MEKAVDSAAQWARRARSGTASPRDAGRATHPRASSRAKPTLLRALAPFAAALALAPATWGCGRDAGVPDGELGDLVLAPKQPEKPVSVDSATRDAAELGRAVLVPHHRLADQLGPHRLTIKTSMQLLPAGGQAPLEQLTDDIGLEFASPVAWHASSNNSADYGREVTFVDGDLFLRARYQRWHQRKPSQDGEPAELRDRFYEGAAAHWDLLAPAIAVADGGELTFAGRPAHKIVLSTAAQPRRPATELTAQRKWREGRTVEKVEGEAVLDASSGALLKLTLRGTVGLQREGRGYSMRVSVDSAVTDLGTAPAITAPPAADVVQTPVRLHEVDERDKLLEKIAPPLRSTERAPRAAPAASASAPVTPAPGQP